MPFCFLADSTRAWYRIRYQYMNTKYLIPLCAAVALLAACGQRESNPSVGGDSSGVPGNTPTDATGPSGDTATTPGGNAGEASTTPGSPTAPAETPPPITSDRG
jgi:hypothetical protein